MGSYVSYGISAFNVSKFIRPTLSYSEDFLMPVAYYDENSFMLLKDRFTIVKDQTGDWELRTPVAFDEELYKKWVEMIIPTNT